MMMLLTYQKALQTAQINILALAIQESPLLLKKVLQQEQQEPLILAKYQHRQE